MSILWTLAFCFAAEAAHTDISKDAKEQGLLPSVPVEASQGKNDEKTKKEGTEVLKAGPQCDPEAVSRVPNIVY